MIEVCRISASRLLPLRILAVAIFGRVGLLGSLFISSISSTGNSNYSWVWKLGQSRPQRQTRCSHARQLRRGDGLDLLMPLEALARTAGLQQVQSVDLELRTYGIGPIPVIDSLSRLRCQRSV